MASPRHAQAASLWHLPVVYVIENNLYGMGTSVARASAVTELYRRGESFGIPGFAVDGMDVRTVRGAAEFAVEHARSGKGPILLEMKTYRFRGHSMSDPAKYRSKDELNRMKAERDPIELVKKLLIDSGEWDEAKLKGIDREIKDIVVDAADFAQENPEPDPSELWTDVLVES